jgi:para-nitrobenzyl esterase
MSAMNRRSFLGRGAVAAGVVTSAARRALGAETNGPAGGPVVETTYGKIRGQVINRVNAFQGIPYGAPTGGAGRFMPPSKPQAWAGIKDTIEWGPEAPQGPHTEIPEVAATIPKGTISEDCLRLNVWTASLNRNAKRPVMVWLHGGGFTSGNGSYSMYNGANMARKREVVMLSINHRLNSFGFLYLPEIGGPKFANASNAGILDVVAALEWVRDNIANFGGDPNNVTIFGQSGGAGKVSTLLAMPSAKGLFHKAIVQSGANLTGVSRADATRTAQTLMTKLGVKTAGDLQKIPMDQLVQATLSTPGLSLAPVADGKTLPGGPFDPAAPEISADIPLLIGSTEYEVTFFPNTKYDPLDDAALHAAVKQATRAGDADADRIIGVYKKGRPGLTNLDYSLILASDNFSARVTTEAERKAAQRAPVYKYYFTWQSPVREGKLKSFHTLEIPFVMENVDEAKSMTGTGQSRYALQDKMSAAWAAFARTGNPNHKGLPQWTAFNMAQRATMVFDNVCKLVNDPHGAERMALASVQRGA